MYMDLYPYHINIRSVNQQLTPLLKASILNYISKYEIMDLLIEKGADINVTDGYNRTVLHNLSFQDHFKCIDILKKILSLGFKLINQQDFMKNTVLHNFVQFKSIDYIDLLIKYKIDPEILNYQNDNALSLICNNQLMVKRFMMTYGVKAYTSNNCDKKTKQLVDFYQKQRQEIIKLMEQNVLVNQDIAIVKIVKQFYFSE